MSCTANVTGILCTVSLDPLYYMCESFAISGLATPGWILTHCNDRDDRGMEGKGPFFALISIARSCGAGKDQRGNSTQLVDAEHCAE